MAKRGMGIRYWILLGMGKGGMVIEMAMAGSQKHDTHPHPIPSLNK